jgi:hypothetical protein
LKILPDCTIFQAHAPARAVPVDGAAASDAAPPSAGRAVKRVAARQSVVAVEKISINTKCCDKLTLTGGVKLY